MPMKLCSLDGMYFRHGQYREVLAQLDQELSDKPNAADLMAIRPMFALLAHYPDLATARRTRDAVSGESLEVPVTVNGVQANYFLDTGMNISIMSESEAKRLGLEVQENSTKLTDISGTPASTRVAEAADLWIGKIHLKNVAFAVYPDENEPWVDVPVGHRGGLGIPVILALGSIGMEGDNHIVLGASKPAPKASSIPLAFDQQEPLAQIQLDGKALTFSLDTGAETTYR